MDSFDNVNGDDTADSNKDDENCVRTKKVKVESKQSSDCKKIANQRQQRNSSEEIPQAVSETNSYKDFTGFVSTGIFRVITNLTTSPPLKPPREITARDVHWGDILSSNPEKNNTPILENPIPNTEIILINGLCSESEANILINLAEEIGFGTTNYPKLYRGNLRLTVFDSSLSVNMWERMKHMFPSELTEKGINYEVVGLNECWRLAKYFQGDQFQSHVDAYFESDDEINKSMFTVNLYMNEEFEGGETIFHLSRGNNDKCMKPYSYSIKPKTGLCLVFRQPPTQHYLHEGKLVTSGIKYLFRSDVMYRVKINHK
eukprot:gene16482-22490_t